MQTIRYSTNNLSTNRIYLDFSNTAEIAKTTVNSFGVSGNAVLPYKSIGRIYQAMCARRIQPTNNTAISLQYDNSVSGRTAIVPAVLNELTCGLPINGRLVQGGEQNFVSLLPADEKDILSYLQTGLFYDDLEVLASFSAAQNIYFVTINAFGPQSLGSLSKRVALKPEYLTNPECITTVVSDLRCRVEELSKPVSLQRTRAKFVDNRTAAPLLAAGFIAPGEEPSSTSPPDWSLGKSETVKVEPKLIQVGLDIKDYSLCVVSENINSLPISQSLLVLTPMFMFVEDLGLLEPNYLDVLQGTKVRLTFSTSVERDILIKRAYETIANNLVVKQQTGETDNKIGRIDKPKVADVAPAIKPAPHMGEPGFKEENKETGSDTGQSGKPKNKQNKSKGRGTVKTEAVKGQISEKQIHKLINRKVNGFLNHKD